LHGNARMTRPGAPGARPSQYTWRSSSSSR
jgi:hypothetical protein